MYRGIARAESAGGYPRVHEVLRVREVHQVGSNLEVRWGRLNRARHAESSDSGTRRRRAPREAAKRSRCPPPPRRAVATPACCSARARPSTLAARLHGRATDRGTAPRPSLGGRLHPPRLPASRRTGALQGSALLWM